jgi:hypothetical protein
MKKNKVKPITEIANAFINNVLKEGDQWEFVITDFLDDYVCLGILDISSLYSILSLGD